MSVDGCKAEQKLIDCIPQLIEHRSHIFNIRLIDAVRGIDTLGKLIKVVASLSYSLWYSVTDINSKQLQLALSKTRKKMMKKRKQRPK